MHVPASNALLVALVATPAWLSGSFAPGPAQDEELVYFEVELGELTWSATGGTDSLEEVERELRRPDRDRAWPARVVLEGGGEAYAVLDPVGGSGSDAVRLVGCTGGGVPVRGTLFTGEGSGEALRLEFELVPAAGGAEARDAFFAGRAAHHRALVAAGVEGAAWFRHGAQADAAQGGRRQAPAAGGAVERERELVRTLQLYSGGRAVAENLQLDRLLPPPDSADRDAARSEPLIPLDEIEGITIEEIDWEERLEGAGEIALEPLLSWIPHDQHVVTAPSFRALAELLDELGERVAPIIDLLETDASSARSREILEEELALSLDELARLFGPAALERVALTGGDLYLRTGTDVTLLFHCRDAALLARYIHGRYDAAAAQPHVERSSAGGIESVRSPYGRVSSSFAREGDVVIVSNSRRSLERVLAARGGRSLADLDETRFFRRRYPLGEEETAFVLMSDAAIRRWAGPRWRIAASRRLRAWAAMLELQARHARELVQGLDEPRLLSVQDERFPPLGTVTLTPRGVHSSIYGSIERLTPILEMDLDPVPKWEARLYERWRADYARNWTAGFDPIAARVVVADETVEVDLTVLPLIGNTQYTTLRSYAGDALLEPDAGDPHPGTLFHAALAIDPEAAAVLELQQMFTGFAPEPVAGIFGWMSGSIAFYADEGRVWDELLEEGDGEAAMHGLWANLNRLPLALVIGSRSAFKLASWMAAVRGFADGAAPGLLQWTTLDDEESGKYVRVSAGPGGEEDLYALYATLPEALVLSLEEETLLASMGRYAQRRAAADGSAVASESAPGWLGESAALRVSGRGLEVLEALIGPVLVDELQDATFASLPILNEWRRLFPDEDPVAVHLELFGERLACAAGGRFVWDEQWRTMASTALGHPARPESPARLPSPLAGLGSFEAGVTFEDEGLRARARLHASRPVRAGSGASAPPR